MSTGLGLSREGQNSGGEGEHKVSPVYGFVKELEDTYNAVEIRLAG